MTYQSTVRRLTLVTAILVAIGLTPFLTAPFGKGISLAQASAENNPATGAPTISGTAQVGETLTAGITGIADADGLSGESFTYQWVSGDGTTDTDIGEGDRLDLQARSRRPGQVRQGQSDLHRRRRQRGDVDQRAHGVQCLGDGPPGAPGNLTVTARRPRRSPCPGSRQPTTATRLRRDTASSGGSTARTTTGTIGAHRKSTTYTTNAQANLANGVKYVFRVKAENDAPAIATDHTDRPPRR